MIFSGTKYCRPEAMKEPQLMGRGKRERQSKPEAMNFGPGSTGETIKAASIPAR